MANINFSELLVFFRLPGNAFAFWFFQTLHWSRGKRKLIQESKSHLFAYLRPDAEEKGVPSNLEQKAIERAKTLGKRFHLEALEKKSTATLYRKNLYLIDTLEKASEGLTLPFSERGVQGNTETVYRALDVGSQDWFYVFGLEKWLKHVANSHGRKIALKGIELDGYGIYPDFHSRKDYADTYVAQTENPLVDYEVKDFLKFKDADQNSGFDFISIFYPFVTRYQLLFWGLPLRFFSPEKFMAHAAALTKKEGWLVVYCHTQVEQNIFLKLTRSLGSLELLREGAVESNLVDFWEEVTERRYSIWKKR